MSNFATLVTGASAKLTAFVHRYEPLASLATLSPPLRCSVEGASTSVLELLQINPALNVHSSPGPSGTLSLDEFVLKVHKNSGRIN